MFDVKKPEAEVINHITSLSSAVRHYENLKIQLDDQYRELRIAEDNINKKRDAVHSMEKQMAQSEFQIRRIAKNL